ncbi:hypothetical protein B0H11DRAFT_1960807 [Mycena galericulata]|nr:hypothetical protein B0H11DRAFT_1960807 [Mycena galericulata]
MTSLPPDVLELLFDEFQSGPSSGGDNVAVCGLVCKAWLPSSRARLFATVVLRERNTKSFLDIVETASHPIQNFIRTLRLIIRSKDTFIKECSEKLGPFPNATTVYIDADIGKWIPRIQEFKFFPDKFPRLANLTLESSDHNSFSTYHILLAITDCPTLESLEVIGQGFNPIDDRVPESFQSFPPLLHTLHLEMPMSGNIFEVLYELEEPEIDLPVLSSLSMQDAWPQDRSFLGRYLYSNGSTMHHLRFDCSSESMFGDPSALRYCKALRHLDLRFDTSKVPGTLLNILQNLRSPSLATINVMDPDHRAGKSVARQADKWEAVDKALAEERFESLKCLSFTGTPAHEEKLRQAMPLCAARGVLRVIR